MSSFRLIAQHTLDALKGWPSPYALDYTTEVDPSVTTEIRPGSVVRLNSSGRYVLGVGTTRAMPLFMLGSSHDFDVMNYGGNPATDKRNWVAVAPTGQATALPATGAYELVSTEFVTGQTYTPNTPLTSPSSGANAGKLMPGTMYTDMIVGLVSRGIVDNGYGFDAVAFWPHPVFPTT